MISCLLARDLCGNDATASTQAHISVNQNLAVEAVEEITLTRSSQMSSLVLFSSALAYGSILGQINRLQSRTQAHICYRSNRCASKAPYLWGLKSHVLHVLGVLAPKTVSGFPDRCCTSIPTNHRSTEVLRIAGALSPSPKP